MAYCFHTYMPAIMSQIWIDTGANNHMCSNKNLMTNIANLSIPFKVALPNKHIILVAQVDTVQINKHLTITNVCMFCEFF